MIKLNRTTEYGLMALRHLLRKGVASGVVSAREVSDTFGLPFEITAKTLQRLKDTGLIHSAQGARGGYSLDVDWSKMSFGRFLELMEGPQAIVSCHATTACQCEHLGNCELTPALYGINQKLMKFMSEIPLSEVVGSAESGKEKFVKGQAVLPVEQLTTVPEGSL
jgi:Rrf2 family protein